MTKTALISAVFASYAALMFAIASLASEAPSEVSQVNSEQTID